jgi:hypothetical protein
MSNNNTKPAAQTAVSKPNKDRPVPKSGAIFLSKDSFFGKRFLTRN